MATIKSKTKEGFDDTEERFIEGENKDSSVVSKIDEVGWLSFVSFSWIFTYLWSAYKGKIDDSKTWNCSIFDSANVNMTRLEHLWNDELKQKPESPSFFWPVLRFMRFRLFISCLIFLLCLIFGFVGPTCLVRSLITYTENSQIDRRVDYFFGFYLVIAILIVEVSRVLLYGATWAVSYRTGIRVRGAVLLLMYKNLMNSRSLRNKTPAEIVNICANDGQRIFDAVTYAPLVLIGPFVLIGGLIYLLRVIGPLSLLGILVFFVFDVLQAFLGITMVKCRNKAIGKTEKRMNLMGEIIRCIRIIKMNAWEDLFINRVIKIRDEEKRFLRIAGYAQSLAVASAVIVPVVATIVMVLSVVLSGSDLKASDAFSSITVFFVMLFGIRMIPYGTRYMAEAKSAISKIQELLLFSKTDANRLPPTQSNLAIFMKEATFAWDQNEKKSLVEEINDTLPESEPFKNDSDKETSESLIKLNLTIEKKELIGIAGPVGSGKTALLQAVAGHLAEKSGEFSVAGTTAFVDQVPYIFNGTIRDNILFGQSMNTQRYYKAISCAELTKDLESMPSNELSEVGERGVALSGGQRTRISLARALFQNRDVYLMDDIFSSIDKHVADKIFRNAVEDLLANKTVLLVTSNPEYLSKCKRIVFLERGRIVEINNHAKLIEKSDIYRNFINDFHKSNFNQHEHNQEELAEKPIQNGLDAAALNGTHTPSTKVHIDDEEDLGLKNISKDIYLEYIKSAGGLVVFTFVIFSFVISVASSIFSTFWLSKWMNDVHDEKTIYINGTVIRKSLSLAQNENVSYYSTVYGLSLLALFVTGLIRAIIFVKVSLTASTKLHNRMLKRVMFAVTTFFDTTPTGRILNRFSKDMDEIDVKLPFSAEALLQYMLTSLGFLLMISWIFPIFLIPCIPLAAIFILFFMCFRSGIRSLKRTENISRSPLFDHILSLDGLVTIHSFGQTSRFVDTFKSKLDENSGAMFMFHSAMRWQAVWLDLLVVAVTFFVSVFIVILTPDSVTPANAGMALAFALQMSGIFQFAVRSQTELEAKLTAVERISYYYKEIAQDDEYESAVELPQTWPLRGDIEFDGVSLKYPSNARLALNDATFKIENAEKVGVVGRTGSGKSSLCNALFRMYPISGGKISISKRDISQIGLRQLRKSMAIIPQDPVLFADTLRFNIDPEHECSDDQIWDSLEKTGLKEKVLSLDEKLEFKVEEGGSNLSSGQRQLVCVARSLLRNVKIVLIDEATANLDSQADSQIQKCVRESFANKTILLITHRLGNVADMDKVLYVDDGKITVENRKHTDDNEEIHSTKEEIEKSTSPTNLYPILRNDSVSNENKPES